MSKTKKTVPLLCWDVYIMQLARYLSSNVPNREADLSMLMKFQEKFGWNIQLDRILSFPYEALVLTDHSQKIKWVNEGFAVMTGYSSKFSLGKSPKFLQGQNTSALTINRIRQKLSKGEVVKEKVCNYRKNGQEYLCEVHIHPLINSISGVTHYLALERELPAA